MRGLAEHQVQLGEHARQGHAGGTICRVAYNGDNIRRKRLDANGTIHYVGTYERNVGNGLDSTEVVTKYYVALGKTIAMRKAGTLYYVGSDHLGSTIRVVDASFNAVDQMRYKPYGESRDAGTNLKTDHKFTSQIEDAIVGLYWYNSRAYDPIIGRFVAPDTIVPEPKNPQALNRYSSVYNNPLRYLDPSGHAAEDLQYLVPGWFDKAWQDEFEQKHKFKPMAADYVYRFLSMGLDPNHNYAAEDLVQSVAVAIGAGQASSGAGLWSQAVDQTQLSQRRSIEYLRGDGSIERLTPASLDEQDFGIGFKEYRWGKLRIVMTSDGVYGRLVRGLGGGAENATTFSDNLIVFTTPLDFNHPGDRTWLMHELGHVMQAQQKGLAYLPRYGYQYLEHGYANHPMEVDANAFASRATTGPPRSAMDDAKLVGGTSRESISRNLDCKSPYSPDGL